ncbi:MAG: hypothetical protein J0H83_12310 [Candidatus Melainabacteria bacterium]|nr:hypothetical protein [Candidatus Melainabacteria bacterium]
MAASIGLNARNGLRHFLVCALVLGNNPCLANEPKDLKPRLVNLDNVAAPPEFIPGTSGALVTCYKTAQGPSYIGSIRDQPQVATLIDAASGKVLKTIAIRGIPVVSSSGKIAFINQKEISFCEPTTFKQSTKVNFSNKIRPHFSKFINQSTFMAVTIDEAFLIDSETGHCRKFLSEPGILPTFVPSQDGKIISIENSLPNSETQIRFYNVEKGKFINTKVLRGFPQIAWSSKGHNCIYYSKSGHCIEQPIEAINWRDLDLSANSGPQSKDLSKLAQNKNSDKIAYQWDRDLIIERKGATPLTYKRLPMQVHTVEWNEANDLLLTGAGSEGFIITDDKMYKFPVGNMVYTEARWIPKTRKILLYDSEKQQLFLICPPLKTNQEQQSQHP